MTARPSNTRSAQNLEAHARRLEGRALIQSCLDGEISEDSPRLKSLLASDAGLRQEFDDFRRLDSMLQAPAQFSSDLTERVLRDLQNRPVFLPDNAHQRTQRSRSGVLSGFALGMAASLALSAGAIYITFAALRSPGRVIGGIQALAQSDLAGDARAAIRGITGNGNGSAHASAYGSAHGSAHGSGRGRYVITPVTESSQIPDIQTVLAEQIDPRSAGSQMAGAGSVRIERAGLSVVNPGPDSPKAPAPRSGHTRAAIMKWNAQPDAMYLGSRSQRFDVPRSPGTQVSADRKNAPLPVAGADIPGSR